MKTMFALFFSLVALAVPAQTNVVHNWTLKSGAVFPGDYYSSGALMVVIKSHGTNCLLKISELSTKDWLYFQDCKAAQRQHQLDAEVAQMRAAGQMEFTAELIENFPEKVVNHYGWMDAYFGEINSAIVDSKADELGFTVWRGEHPTPWFFCRALKKNPYNGNPDPVISEITNLKSGDKVRFIGVVMPAQNDVIFYVSKIEIIRTTADAEAIKKAKRDLLENQPETNPAGLDPNTGLPK